MFSGFEDIFGGMNFKQLPTLHTMSLQNQELLNKELQKTKASGVKDGLREISLDKSNPMNSLAMQAFNEIVFKG